MPVVREENNRLEVSEGIEALMDEYLPDEQSYGTALTDDPRFFHPDPECSTAEELAAHKADVEAWDRGERPNRNHRYEITEHSVDSSKATPWGLGTTTSEHPMREHIRGLVWERDDLRWLVVLLLKNMHPFGAYSFAQPDVCPPREHAAFLEWAGRTYGKPLTPVPLVGPHCRWCGSSKHLGLECSERPPV